jgi:hypothetical protein
MKKWLLIILLFIAIVPLKSKAQGCSVCTKTAAQLGEKGAKGLNGGILYLAFLPLAILGTIGIVWYRHQHA